MTNRSGHGRPPATTHAAIERAAFQLFEERGFDQTTMDDIAGAVGVGRRTLFRYYPSKNDILWGQFDAGLRDFEATFAAMDAGLQLSEAITEGIVAFNALDPSAVPQHRQRMKLLLGTPALLAHSELRYAAWRQVVSNFVASRLGCRRDDLVPHLLGRAALAIALTAYQEWLTDDRAELSSLIREAAAGLQMWSIEVHDEQKIRQQANRVASGRQA